MQGTSSDPVEILTQGEEEGDDKKDEDYIDFDELCEEGMCEEGMGEEGASEQPKRKRKKNDQKALGKAVQQEAKALMSASKNSDMTRSSGVTSLIDPWDERIQKILGGPPKKTEEEAGIALEESKLELKRKQWQLKRDEEEWELKKERDREEFELRKE